MQFHCALAGGLTRTYVFTPTGPWLPGLPGRPGSPFCPRAPRAPTGPALPRNPLTPCGPGSPLGPCLPVDPVLPVAPITPGSPRKPGLPTGPGAPGAPRAPGLPLAASAPAGPGAPAYDTFLSSRVVGIMCSTRHYARVPIAAASQGTRCEHDVNTLDFAPLTTGHKATDTTTQDICSSNRINSAGNRMRTRRQGPFFLPLERLSTGLEAESTLAYHPMMPKSAAIS